MAAFLDEQLKSYGVETKLVELGDQEIEGQTLKLPPAILGSIGTDPKKKTVLIYGHYDVQPVRSLNRALMPCSKTVSYAAYRQRSAMDGTPTRSS